MGRTVSRAVDQCSSTQEAWEAEAIGLGAAQASEPCAQRPSKSPFTFEPLMEHGWGLRHCP